MTQTFSPIQNKTPRQHEPLVRELGWMLMIKSIALFLLWLAFFSEPTDTSAVDTYLRQTLFNPPDVVRNH